MVRRKLSQRGPNATVPARLPGLQGLRMDDPQAQKAFEALREWVEVRLGSRGDVYERAVTRREFEQELAPALDQLDALGDFDGTIEQLSATPASSLPQTVKIGGFVLMSSGDLYFGTQEGWRKVTLTAP